MALVVTIAGVNRTSVTVDGSVYVEQRAADFISVCGLRIVDVNAAINIAAEAAILLDDDVTGEVFFNGRVIDVRYILFGECSSRYINIKCQDLSYQLNETIIDQVEEFPGGAGHGAITADADIIDHLFDDYLPAVDSVAHVDTLQDPLTITFNPCTLRNMLSQICTHTGGYFYIDFDNEVHYFDAEAVGIGWWLTSDPVRDGPATNLILNPSLETNTTSWAALACVLSRDTTYSVFGSAALKVVTDNAGAIEGPYSVITAETAAGTEYTLSAYLRGNGTVRLFLYDNVGGHQYGDVITLTNVWTRYQITKTLDAGAIRQAGVFTNVQQDITFYCDGFQLEQAALASSYFDGSFGTDFAWTGAAHGSTSTRGAGATSYLIRNLDMATTATTVLDGVFVIGSEVSGWRGTHAPGDRQGIARDNRITTAQGVIDRGDAILGKYGAAQEVYTVATYQAGLRAGYDILFICEIWGVNATLTVRKMIVKWDGCGTPYYTLTLGAVVNPSLIGERSWIDGLTDSVTITAPMLPTSSRGWSQNIVFSATDHNTVAWAGGGTITLADGTVYTINAGNTGNMVAITYIYLDLDVVDNALQTTDDAAVAVGSKIVLVAVAQNVADATKLAIFQVFGGAGQGVLVAQGHIAALSVTTNEIAANTILAGNIAADTITANEIAAATITATEIAANTITADKIEMGIGDGLFNLADGLLLLNPHCEISTTEWWSARKQLATLSGAFHREAGRWLGTRGLVVEEATTNLILNPSIEVDTTGWIVVNDCVISRDTTYSVFGDASLKLVTGDTGNNEGAYTVVTAQTAAATEYTLSCYLRGSGSIYLWFYDVDAGHQVSPLITLTNVWTRYDLTKTFGAGAVRQIGLFTGIQAGVTYYGDGFQLEAQDYATSYCDGSLGTGYAWTGAAHGSTSTRTATEVNLDAHVGLIYDNVAWSIAMWVQMPLDYDDPAWPAVSGLFFSAYEDANNYVNVFFLEADNKIYGRYKQGTIVNTSYEFAFSAGDWVYVVVNYDTAGDLELFVNGLLRDSTDLSAKTVIQPTQMNLGAWFDGSYTSLCVHAEVAILDRVLTPIEIAGMYAMTRPMIDMGSLDMPGIYILDGRFRIASSTTGNRIDITADEIAGYDSGGTKQFYLSAADGTAYAGAGAVVLDASGLYTIRDGVAGTRGSLRWLYDNAGVIDEMGRIFGDWGGAGPVYVWLRAHRGAGDPWDGARVIIQAQDDVAATDVRIVVQSTGLVEIGGTRLNIAGDVFLLAGDLDVDGAAEFNKSLADKDFIVGSDNEANMLRVDAAEDEVRLGDWDTNYSAFEVDGTLKMVGTATVFNDVYIPTTVGKLGGANTPTWEAFIDVTEEYTFAVGDLIHLPAVEIPHSYKEGSDIKIHCHIVTNGSDVGDADVRYEIVYTIGDMGETMSAAVGFASLDITIDGGTADRHHKYIFIGTIPGAGLKVGAALKMRFNRKVLIGAGDPPTDDPFVLMVGVHVEEDTVGSRTLLAK